MGMEIAMAKKVVWMEETSS